MFDRDKEYLDFIKTQSCILENYQCVGDVVPHHTSGGGMGIKGSDYDTIPCCYFHHDLAHRSGKISFYSDNNIDRWELVADNFKEFYRDKREYVEELEEENKQLKKEVKQLKKEKGNGRSK